MKIFKVSTFKPFGPLKRRLTGCCLVIFLGFLLACGLFCGLSYYLGSRAAAQTADQGADEILLLIDNSNSMFEKNGLGSDPELLRIQAAKLFISYLGVDSGELAHRLGVIFFGGQAQLVVPLTSLSDNASAQRPGGDETRRAELARLISQPTRLEWTNPQAALELAEATFAASPTLPARRAVVLLTDGKPEWSNTPTPAEQAQAVAGLEEVAHRLAEADIPLFIILLQNAATDADPEIEQVYAPLWQKMAAATTPGRFYRARQNQDLLDIYHDIVVTLTGRQTAGIVLQTSVSSQTVQPVMVEPGLLQVTFVIRKSDPALQVQIVDPAGQPLRQTGTAVQHSASHPGGDAGQPGQSLEEIWAVTQPLPGVWQVRLEGQGAVTVWKDFYPAPAAPTFTPPPTATPTATPSPSPTPTRLPTATPISTPIPSPTPTCTPTPAALSVRVTFTPQPPASVSSPPPSLSNWLWGVGLPLFGLLAGGGGWWWLKHRTPHPLLTGALRLVAAPVSPGIVMPAQLDLDQLNRRDIEVGPGSQATLRLAPSTPDSPHPTVRLNACLEPDHEPGVLLTVMEPAGAGLVQVNHLPLNREWRLRDGDVITLGAYKFKYENLRQRGREREKQWGVRSRE